MYYVPVVVVVAVVVVAVVVAVTLAFVMAVAMVAVTLAFVMAFAVSMRNHMRRSLVGTRCKLALIIMQVTNNSEGRMQDSGEEKERAAHCC